MKQVTVTQTEITLPSYRTPAAESLPMFAENRVHQRSSGNPYPNRVVVKVDHEQREEKAYRLIRLENEYLRIELLPELGGRIYSALDKSTGYDFLYKQHVVKPALIGMLGLWISGGIEFNWPCHHRPSTFMPVDTHIERAQDGSVTVWMSEHEPLNRMKGMVGVRLAPGEAIFETRMRVYNRTELRRSFLWWQNAAVPVNEQYRLFFPPDVHFVQYHYRKDVIDFPVASGVYNGIRLGKDVDIREHKNTREPTSYFSASSRYSFFGGYDEGKRAGVVHVADPGVSVGKKMFTWAYDQLAQSWERALTDEDGAYAELMAGSYSANQPDFAWLEPYEEKSFEQCWYPLAALGTPVCATKRAALAIEGDEVRFQLTRAGKVSLVIDGERHQAQALPGEVVSIAAKKDIHTVRILGEGDEELLAYAPQADRPAPKPQPLAALPTLDEIKTAQDGYLAGVHVDQYRDPTIRPEAYWREALRHDPDHAPSLLALAERTYDLMKYEEARAYAERAWATFTRWNFHPESGRVAYVMGLISEARGEMAEALDWYRKAAWAQDCVSRAMTRIAALDGRGGRYEDMRAHAEAALNACPWNHLALCEAAVAAHHLGKSEEARALLTRLLTHDPLDLTAHALASLFSIDAPEIASLTSAYQNALDVRDDLALMGVESAPLPADDQIAFPLRASEIQDLQKRRLAGDRDAAYALGCALYAKLHYAEAARLWEECVREDATDWRALRNLAIAYYSHLNRRDEALALLKRASDAKPDEEQLAFEYAYLSLRAGLAPASTHEFLKSRSYTRDDIFIEHALALNLCAKYEEALGKMTAHAFIPCEGGEHAVAKQYMFAQHALGRTALRNGALEEALARFKAAQHLPETLGAGLWHEALLVPHRVYEAECLRRLGEKARAEAIEADIASLARDFFSNMHLPELGAYQAVCLQRLGRREEARALLAEGTEIAEGMRGLRDAGYYGATPFFISYMQPAEKEREADALWRRAMIRWAAGDADEATALAREALKRNPANLYASLLANGDRRGDEEGA